MIEPFGSSKHPSNNASTAKPKTYRPDRSVSETQLQSKNKRGPIAQERKTVWPGSGGLKQVDGRKGSSIQSMQWKRQFVWFFYD